MRNLSKIIFINSANIPYSETRLDGNVHFIGTQGVGKSTILRAILFFYNASPIHLGIPKEKKNFDAFYFPFSNSYIIYEVERENGSYSIIVYKSMGRVCYRFVDAPYDRAWFIGLGNKVYEDWTEVRHRISESSGTQPSRKVATFELFRDIIYGNNRRPEMVDFRKYAIVESPKYQNIPRTIQNVFLNTKLDADFIKDTIIKSMTDDDLSIDLDYFRNQIREFENEYNDIYLWLKKEANGTNRKTIQAEDVLRKYNAILYSRKHIRELREELNYALRQCLESKPETERLIGDTLSELERAERLISEETGKYNKELDALKKSINILGDKINESRKRKRKYDDMRISEIIRRVKQEESLTSEKANTEAILRELTSGSRDISLKYKRIEDSLRSAAAENRNILNAELSEFKSNKAEEKERIISEGRKTEDRIRSLSAEDIRASEESVSGITDQLNAERVRRERIARTKYHEKEISEKESEIKVLEKIVIESEAEKKSLHREKESIAREEDMLLKECEMKYHTTLSELSGKSTEIKKTIDEINSILDGYRGSLCEWLSENVSGWERNIGKVIDDRNILYNRSLSPKRVEYSGNIFGITLELSGIEKEILTPEILKGRKNEAEQRKEDIDKEIDKAINEREAEKNAIVSKANRKAKTLDARIQEIGLCCYESNEATKKLNVEINNLNKAGKEKKEKDLNAIEHRIEDFGNRLELAKAALSQSRETLNKKIIIAQKSTDSKISAIEAGFKEKEHDINRRLLQLNENLDYKLAQNDKERLLELENAGADVASMKRYESAIREIDNELSFIKNHRSDVSDYEKDKRELFDNEEGFISEKKEVEAKVKNLDERFRLRKDRLETERDRLLKIINDEKERLKTINDNVHEANNFLEDSTLNPYTEQTDEEKQASKSCREITNDLRSRIISRENDMKAFKSAVTVFKDGFSPRNLFNFKTGMVTDQEYMDFAAGLDSFISNDMLQEYQKRISERYTDIIRRIAKETSDLTQNRSEINKVINEINEDFSKDNFVGAIKNISLRQLASENRLVQLLLTIKEFNEENQYNMGEIDLFSQGDRTEVNTKAVDYLMRFMKALQNEPSAKTLDLSDSFKLEFRIVENDNDTGWVEKISNVGSDGTDILVKAMINIMLINVFKERASRKFGDFRIHCMMDEIGKLHPNNVKGILMFANKRNILLVNSSPTTFNAEDYKYTYLLEKDKNSRTHIIPLISHLD